MSGELFDVDIESLQSWAAQRDLWVVVKSPFQPGDEWTVGMTTTGCSGWNGRPDFVGRGESFIVAAEQCVASVVKDQESDQ